MANSSFEWNEEDPPPADKADRYWNFHYENMRKAGEKRRAREEAERNRPPRPPEPTPEPQPSKAGKFARRALVVLILLGGPSVTALILHNTLEGDNDPTKMDFVQALEGIGIFGSIATVVVILIMAGFMFD